MLLADPNFVAEEAESPFMNNNNHFLETQTLEKLKERTQKWLKFLAISENEEQDPNRFLEHRDKDKEEKDQKKRETEGPSDEAIRRIVVLDAERTFKTDRRRKELSDFLYEVATSFGNYHQALSYVSAFLMLTFPKPVVFKILSKLNSEKKYVVKYWQETAVGMATDAYVLQEITQKLLPEVAAHLSKNTIFPETYCPKWFCGLCTQILPIEDLFDFFEKFLESGCTFLFQFGLSLFLQTKSSLLKANDPTTLFTILRLDPIWVGEQSKSLIKDIISNTNQFDLSSYDYDEMRTRLYKLHLQERLERSAKLQQEQKAQNDDDDDDELFGSDDEGENTGECQVCENLQADVYCADCKLLMCDLCNKKNKNGHSSKAHKVTNVDDLSEDMRQKLNLE